MDQVPIVREWKAAARREGHKEGMDVGIQEGHRRAIRKTVRTRFATDLPVDLEKTLQQIEDATILDRWLELSVQAATLADFHAAISPPKTNGIANPKSSADPGAA